MLWQPYSASADYLLRKQLLSLLVNTIREPLIYCKFSRVLKQLFNLCFKKLGDLDVGWPIRPLVRCNLLSLRLTALPNSLLASPVHEHMNTLYHFYADSETQTLSFKLAAAVSCTTLIPKCSLNSTAEQALSDFRRNGFEDEKSGKFGRHTPLSSQVFCNLSYFFRSVVGNIGYCLLTSFQFFTIHTVLIKMIHPER